MKKTNTTKQPKIRRLKSLRDRLRSEEGAWKKFAADIQTLLAGKRVPRSRARNNQHLQGRHMLPGRKLGGIEGTTECECLWTKGLDNTYTFCESILSTKGYQVVAFSRAYPELLKRKSSRRFLAKWEDVFKSGKGNHTRHMCAINFCTKHTVIGTRQENEEDKHWQYFTKHPRLGQKFISWARRNASDLLSQHVHI